MKPLRKMPIDFSTSFLSAFDIGGSLIFGVLQEESRSENDMNKLMSDQNNLENDYKTACEKIKNSNGNS